MTFSATLYEICLLRTAKIQKGFEKIVKIHAKTPFRKKKIASYLSYLFFSIKQY